MMKLFVNIVLVLAATAAAAFDSEAWLLKRGDMTRDAMRLKDLYSEY